MIDGLSSVLPAFGLCQFWGEKAAEGGQGKAKKKVVKPHAIRPRHGAHR